MDPSAKDCEAAGGELMERYVANRLSEEERRRVEEHYFSCPRCLARLNALQAVRSALEEERAAAADHVPRRARGRRSNWWWPSLAAAAAVLIAVAVAVMLRPRPGPPVASTPARARRPSMELAELARIEPPAYAPPTLRGSTGAAERSFRAAMKRYEAGDYSGAIPGLRALADAHPNEFDARFYLGACELLTGNTRQGIADLQRVAAAGDRSPYSEEAHYDLGKAWLQVGDVAAARREFETVVATHGDLQAKAAALLGRLRNL